MVNVPWCHKCNEPDLGCKCEMARGQNTKEQPDFTIGIYKGFLAPEDSVYQFEKKPKDYKLFSRWREENKEFFTQSQFESIAARLRAGRTWVVFDTEVQTLKMEPGQSP